jgi:hypothetical protein
VHRLESVQDTLLHFLHSGIPDSVPLRRAKETEKEVAAPSSQ